MMVLAAAAVLVVTQASRTAEFRFPNQPIGASTVGMGGAGVAVAADAEGALNPATVVVAPLLSLQRFDGFVGYHGTVLAAALPIGHGVVVGVSARQFGWDQLVEDDLGLGTADLTAREQSLTIAAAVAARGWLSLGLAASSLRSDNLSVVTAATGVSVGAMLSPTPRWRIGFALRTLGPPARVAGGDATYELPARVRAGVLRHLTVARRPVGIAIDAETPLRSRRPDVHAGLEAPVAGALMLRAGYQCTADPDVEDRVHGSWGLGATIRFNRMRLSIASRFGRESLGQETFLALDVARGGH
jgi:hypothetical protein